VIVAPGLAAAQEQAWHALLAVDELLPQHWCLVGGQLVHLWCWERGQAPNRPTDDGDAVLDVRASANILRDFTHVLRTLGFGPDDPNAQGHQHRWVCDDAKIDVLIPSGVGQRAAARRGVGGATTLQTPGAQQALTGSERVEVRIGDRDGWIRRPSLQAALVMKAAAYTTIDPDRRRHLTDFAVLASLVVGSDRIADNLKRRNLRYLTSMLDNLQKNRAIWIGVTGAEDGIARLRLALGLPAA
jgi:hypothetical protein